MTSSSGNPYLPYVEQLDAQLYPAMPRGFPARLAVLWALVGLALVGASVHLGLIIVDVRRKEHENVWIARLVRRDNGRYIVLNTRIVHAIMSIICLLVVVGVLWSGYDININHGSQKWAAAWGAFPSLSFATHGWLVSWAQLQGYILTPDQNSGIASPLLANLLFTFIGVLLAAGLLTCGSIVTVAGMHTWDKVSALRTALQELAASWTSGINLSALLALQAQEKTIFASEANVRTVSIAFGFLAVFTTTTVLVLNLGSIALARLVSRQVRVKIEGLTSTRVTEFAWTKDSTTSLNNQVIGRSTFLNSEIGGMTFGRDTMSGQPTRANIRQLATGGVAPGAVSEQARQIRVLQKAERDLIVISTLVGVVALISTGIALYSTIATIQRVARKSPELYEFMNFGFLWIYALALCLTSPVFIHNAYQNLSPSEPRNDDQLRRASSSGLSVRAESLVGSVKNLKSWVMSSVNRAATHLEKGPPRRGGESALELRPVVEEV